MKKTILLLATVAMLVACSQTEPQPAASDPAEAVMANILNRKSVRSYTSDTIPAAVMENLLRAAMAAPSGGCPLGQRHTAVELRRPDRHHSL